MRRNLLHVFRRDGFPLADIGRQLLQFAAEHRQIASAGKGQPGAGVRVHLFAEGAERLIHPLRQPRVAQRVKGNCARQFHQRLAEFFALVRRFALKDEAGARRHAPDVIAERLAFLRFVLGLAAFKQRQPLHDHQPPVAHHRQGFAVFHNLLCRRALHKRAVHGFQSRHQQLFLQRRQRAFADVCLRSVEQIHVAHRSGLELVKERPLIHRRSPPFRDCASACRACTALRSVRPAARRQKRRSHSAGSAPASSY